MQRNNNRYSVPAITFHWIIAALIVFLFGLGWYMTDLPKGPVRTPYFSLHKSIGLTVAGLALLRLLWRLTHRPPVLPAAIPDWQRRASGFVHTMLYVFMFLQPISGYVSSSFSGYSTKYFGVPLPNWGWKDHALNQLFTDVHVVSSFILLGLIIIHVSGALLHAVKGDGVIGRMLPLGSAARAGGEVSPGAER